MQGDIVKQASSNAQHARDTVRKRAIKQPPAGREGTPRAPAGMAASAE
jgi:hypothetical protein